MQYVDPDPGGKNLKMPVPETCKEVWNNWNVGNTGTYLFYYILKVNLDQVHVCFFAYEQSFFQL